jgi:hypothetical protein
MGEYTASTWLKPFRSITRMKGSNIPGVLVSRGRSRHVAPSAAHHHRQVREQAQSAGACGRVDFRRRQGAAAGRDLAGTDARIGRSRRSTDRIRALITRDQRPQMRRNPAGADRRHAASIARCKFRRPCRSIFYPVALVVRKCGTDGDALAERGGRDGPQQYARGGSHHPIHRKRHKHSPAAVDEYTVSR